MRSLGSKTHIEKESGRKNVKTEIYTLYKQGEVIYSPYDLRLEYG